MAECNPQLRPWLPIIGEHQDTSSVLKLDLPHKSTTEAVKDRVNLSRNDLLLSVPTSKVLTNQILKHYEEIEALESKLKEILDIQQRLTGGLSKENQRFEDVYQNFNFIAMFNQVSQYTKKLHHLRNEMIMIQERVLQLKQRAALVKDYQERKVREMKEAKARQEERERLLTAKPVWEVD